MRIVFFVFLGGINLVEPQPIFACLAGLTEISAQTLMQLDDPTNEVLLEKNDTFHP